MDEYKMVLESQLGPREGTLRLEEHNGEVEGTISLLGYENGVLGERTGGNTLRLSHHLKTIVSDLSCVSLLETEGNKIFGILQNNRNTMQWYGEKMTEKKDGNEKDDGE